MRRALEVGVVTASSIALVMLAVAAIAVAMWARDTRLEIARLEATRDPGVALPVASPAEMAGLPSPVARYLLRALQPGQQSIRTAIVRHAGEFRLQPSGSWYAFTSEQFFVATPPGFVWDARIRMAPFVTVRVRDSYVDGEAAIRATLDGIVPLARRRATTALAEGALSRRLGEAFWIPTGLLPHAGVSWEAGGDSTACATLTDHGRAVSLHVHFDAEGNPSRLTGVRMRDVNGVGVPTPTEFTFADFRRVAGMLIPMRAEAAWLLPEGRFAYWRGTITDARYEFADGRQ